MSSSTNKILLDFKKTFGVITMIKITKPDFSYLKEKCKTLGRADLLSALPVFLKWLVLATLIGVIVGSASALFGHTLTFINSLRAQHPYLIFGLPVGGLFIVFLYRVSKNADDRGTNTVLYSVRSEEGIPFKMAPLIFVSTAITHLFGGSAGREGAAVQLGGSIANKIGKLLHLGENSRRIIVMCGISAGFSALFGTPLAAAFFSLEVVSVGIMHYSALVPCVTAALTGYYMAGLFQLPPEVFPVTDVPTIAPLPFLQILALSACAGVISILFYTLLHKTEHIYEKHLKNPYLRITIAGCLIVALSLLLGNQYLGSGIGIIEHIFHEGDTQWYSFLLKMLFTALTLGAGFKGGEIVPSLCIGAAFGCTVAPLLGLPVEIAAACGMTGVFCGVTNCPITSLLIAFELFGFQGMPWYLTTVAVSYLLSGYGGLYRKQKIVCSKTQLSFTDTHR